MNGPAQYLHIGFILISVASLLVIALLIAGCARCPTTSSARD